eukprot:5452623-Pleurochrysis_carterae.AAC.7
MRVTAAERGRLRARLECDVFVDNVAAKVRIAHTQRDDALIERGRRYLLERQRVVGGNSLEARADAPGAECRGGGEAEVGRCLLIVVRAGIHRHVAARRRGELVEPRHEALELAAAVLAHADQHVVVVILRHLGHARRQRVWEEAVDEEEHLVGDDAGEGERQALELELEVPTGLEQRTDADLADHPARDATGLVDSAARVLVHVPNSAAGTHMTV